MPPAFAGVLVAGGFALFALPGATVQGYALQDLMTFFGWINALQHGRVPSVDFGTPVGALAHLLPYWCSRISGQYAGALEAAGALVAALLLAAASAALRARASAGVTALFLAAVFGMCCVPWNPGDGGGMVSQFGFYNRWGWAAIAVLFLLGASGQGAAGNRWRLDAAVVAGMLLFLFFLKMSYFAVAFVFVVGFGLALRRFARAAVAGLAVFCAVVATTQAATGMVLPYLAQVGEIIRATGVVWTEVLRVNLPPIWPLCALAATAAVLTVRKGNAARDLAMPLFALAACLLLSAQNGPSASAFALLPAFAQAAALVEGERARWVSATVRIRNAAVVGMMAAFLLPQLASQTIATTFYVNITHVGGDGWGQYREVEVPAAGKVYTRREDEAYARTLRSGVALGRAAEPSCSTVANLDLAQPFGALLGLPPSKSFFWSVDVGRSVRRDTAPGGLAVFADVDCVMWPKRPDAPESTAFLLDLYGDYLAQAFPLTMENADWRLLRKRPVDVQTPAFNTAPNGPNAAALGPAGTRATSPMPSSTPRPPERRLSGVGTRPGAIR